MDTMNVCAEGNNMIEKPCRNVALHSFFRHQSSTSASVNQCGICGHKWRLKLHFVPAASALQHVFVCDRYSLRRTSTKRLSEPEPFHLYDQTDKLVLFFAELQLQKREDNAIYQSVPELFDASSSFKISDESDCEAKFANFMPVNVFEKLLRVRSKHIPSHVSMEEFVCEIANDDSSITVSQDATAAAVATNHTPQIATNTTTTILPPPIRPASPPPPSPADEQQQDAYAHALDNHTLALQQHTRALQQHTRALQQHTLTLQQHTFTLDPLHPLNPSVDEGDTELNSWLVAAADAKVGPCISTPATPNQLLLASSSCSDNDDDVENAKSR